MKQQYRIQPGKQVKMVTVQTVNNGEVDLFLSCICFVSKVGNEIVEIHLAGGYSVALSKKVYETEIRGLL